MDIVRTVLSLEGQDRYVVWGVGVLLLISVVVFLGALAEHREVTKR